MILSYAENEALEAVMDAANVTTKMKVPGSDDADASAEESAVEESTVEESAVEEDAAVETAE